MHKLNNQWQVSFYRTAAGAEIDLVLEGPGQQVWAIEIKRSSAPKVSKGFHLGCEDIKATRRFVVYSGQDHYPMATGVEVIGLQPLLELLGTQIKH